MAKNTANYGNDSIRQLKDEERVRLRPAVIFGSDGLDGCAHAAFEILSNAVDEARQGYGKLITLTAFRDGSIQVEDNGRGCPLDWNPSEKRFNWELVFCELYAGGKYNNNQGGDYDFSLGTNGLGSCATQYASEYMDVTVWRDGNKYSLHFKKGKVVGAKKKALEIEPSDENRTGTTIKWRPDLEVFTSISIPHDWYRETMRRQAVVNANVTFRLRIEGDDGEFSEEDFCYPKGIEDYVLEKVGTDYLTEPFFIEADRRGRDREDLPDYNVKITACMCFSRTFTMQEYYHNSSWLENGGSPEKAARSALTSAIDAYIKQQGKYNKNESGIKWQDVQDCLVLVTNCFSTQTSYENQTKKAINNRFIQQAMTAFFKERLSTYLIENKDAANKIMEQVLINKRSRENAEKTRQSIKTNLQQKTDMANRVQKFIDCRSKDKSRREIYIVEGDSAAGAIRTSRDAEFQGVMPVRGKILNCLKEDYPRIFKSDIIMDLMRVLGCGVDVVYPPENDRLYEDVAASGVLLSEYPPGAEPFGWHFPARNRILSGLCLATLVVEAPEKSGALITAATALEQGREVFAVPGPFDAPKSRGCNALIREGAGLVCEAWDVLSFYESRFPHKLRPLRATIPPLPKGAEPESDAPAVPVQETPAPTTPVLPVLDISQDTAGLTDDQIAVLSVLQADIPTLTDDAALLAELPVRRVLSALTVLEIDGYVCRQGARSFLRTVELKKE